MKHFSFWSLWFRLLLLVGVAMGVELVTVQGYVLDALVQGRK